jgi:hypothetical protein
VGATGLQSRAFLNPERQDVKDLVHAIRDNDITEMSFAFRIDDGTWNDDFSEFRIRKVDLDRGDVSAVNYGANPYTSIAARSSELLRDLDRLPVGAARAALERLQARRELQPTVVDLSSGTLPIRRLEDAPAPQNGSGEPGPVLPASLLPPSETARGATFTVAGDRWYQVKPDAQIFARAGDSDELVSLGWVDDIQQLDAVSGGPAQVRTTPLPPSSLIPPVKGLSNDQRSDLGRSVRMVRTEWMIEDEDD